MNCFDKEKISRLLYGKDALLECPSCNESVEFFILGYSNKNISSTRLNTDSTIARMITVVCSNCGYAPEFLATVLGISHDGCEKVKPSDFIKDLMKDGGITTNTLATLIQQTPDYIEKLLDGKIRISNDIARRLEYIFNLSHNYISIMQDNYYT